MPARRRPRAQREIELGAVALSAAILRRSEARRSATGRSGGFCRAKSTWKSGERLEVALRMQLRDELLEGQVLVGVGAEARLAHPREQLPEGRVARELGAQHQRVDEEADQPLGLGAACGPRWGCPPHVLLPGDGGEQRVERREERHEGRHALAAGEILERPR